MIFLDMDGVLADFEKGFSERFNVSAYTFPANDPAMWKLINEVPNFFRTLPKIEGAVDFYDWLLYKGFDPVVLTACPASDFFSVAEQKKGWIEEHIGDEDASPIVIPTWGASTKIAYMQNPGDILIDDWDKNCKAWVEAGGKAIQFTGDWESVKEQVREYYSIV